MLLVRTVCACGTVLGFGHELCSSVIDRIAKKFHE
jgi:hypothetical protein